MNDPPENILTHCEMVQHKRDTLTEIRANKQLSIFNRVTLRIAHYIYLDSKLLVPVLYFCLFLTGLWAVWAEQNPPYTWFLPRSAKLNQMYQTKEQLLRHYCPNIYIVVNCLACAVLTNTLEDENWNCKNLIWFSQWKHGRKRSDSESVHFVYFCKLRGTLNKEK